MCETPEFLNLFNRYFVELALAETYELSCYDNDSSFLFQF